MCNYCTHKRMKEQAEEKGHVLLESHRPLMPYFPNGVGVYSVSKASVDSHKTYVLPDEPDAWFGEIGTACCCSEVR